MFAIQVLKAIHNKDYSVVKTFKGAALRVSVLFFMAKKAQG